MTEEEKKWESAKDGCSYSLDLSKQFITLASAGLAFVVGLATTEASRPPLWLTLAALLGFTGSVLFGLMFHMKVTGNVSGEQNYNAFDTVLKFFAKVQMALFAFGVLILGVVTVINTLGSATGGSKNPSLEVRSGQTTISIPLAESAAMNLAIGTNRQVTISINGITQTNSP